MSSAAPPKIEWGLNVPMVHVTANIEASIRRGIKQAVPCAPQDDPVALVLGGPSLEDTFPLLEQKHGGGMKVISVNGTHNWLLERGIKPSAHIMVDARKSNARFVENWQPGTKYLIASQCHPWVFKALEGADVYMFHPIIKQTHGAILEDYYGDDCWITAGGSTVALRAFPLLSMLGFKYIEVFGFDSCYRDENHHAYEQDVNDDFPKAEITVAGRKFVCDGWMHSQADQFLRMTQKLGDDYHLLVHGDGLISHLINTGAEMREVN